MVVCPHEGGAISSHKSSEKAVRPALDTLLAMPSAGARNGTVGDEIVTVRAQATGSGTHVAILLGDDPMSDGTLNMYALGPVTYLLAMVDQADPG